MTFAVSSRFPLSLAGLGRNLYGHLAFVPAHLPGGRTRAEVDALLVDSSLPCDTFNKITRLRLPEGRGFDARLLALEKFFQGRPFTWWLGPDTEPDNLGAELERRGLRREEVSVGMNLDLSRLSGQEPDTAVPLTVRPARHPSELAAYAALLAANWEPPDTCVTQAYAGAEAALLTPRCPLRFVVGYADGEAVCGAEFRLGPGTLAGVYGLVTAARFCFPSAMDGSGRSTRRRLHPRHAPGVGRRPPPVPTHGLPPLRRLGGVLRPPFSRKGVNVTRQSALSLKLSAGRPLYFDPQLARLKSESLQNLASILYSTWRRRGWPSGRAG